ncbi:Alpha/Beta hydrolase protein [Roridomyces roridus]|uniref:Alpha/Beta hydrolase protein n=1 Tax=Roridomyces roridus TaxID=1738132 RepID=A0AAD7FH80_9AGAR|nr:Alpha/Beta hydrolase protein [Roridomyces roridus]
MALVGVLLPLPVILAWTALAHSFKATKPMKRILGDHSLRYLSSHLTTAQLQYVLGTTDSVYKTWTEREGLEVVVDELGEDAKLLWIGPKRMDRVLLVLHGGGYFLPLEKQGIMVGVALLQYSLAPFATFPTQLEQTLLAITTLLSAGLPPKRLIISGDSAGANFAFQFVSHIMHGDAGLDSHKLQLSGPIAGICAISPWVSLTADSESWSKNDGIDFLSRATAAQWGGAHLAELPRLSASASAYLEPAKAPSGWFDEMHTVVDRVLITAGDCEGLYDHIVAFARRDDIDAKNNAKVELMIQEGGLHEDPMLDFNVGLSDERLGSITQGIVEWFVVGFSA